MKALVPLGLMLLVSPVFAQMREQSFLGVGVAEVDATRAKDLKLNEVHGVEVTRIEDDTAAVKAGLKVGDVVLEYNGQRVEGTEQFIRMVRETPPGREVKLLISRNGTTQNLTAVMGSHKPNVLFGHAGPMSNNIWFNMPEVQIPDMPRVFTGWSSPMLGIEAEALTRQLGEFFGVKEGVLVRSVAKGSAAEKAGIKAGDVVMKIDQTVVTTPSELSNAVRAVHGKQTLAIELMRDKKETTVSVTIDQSQGEPMMMPPLHPIHN
ncbi:MAG: PDZ domain-containing protein [Acidobacteriaceae bacterium]|nr:PDZ domain-containing protein [Acidobacteriaceae bacterium]